MKNQFFTLGLGLLLNTIALAQQDVHFSQFFSSPMTINPASAGAFDGNIRGNLLYRDQWSSIGEPFTTMAASVDFPVFKKMKTGMFGMGFNFYKDDAGDSQFSQTKYSLALAYHLDLSGGKGKQFISVGFQAGGIQRSLSLGNLSFNDQWDGTNFNQTIVTPDQFGGTSKNVLDVATGIHWWMSPKAGTTYFGGISMYHLNAPDVSFNGQDDSFLRRFSIHGGAEIATGNQSDVSSSSFSVLPNIIYTFQGPNRYFNLGTEGKFKLKNNSKYTNFQNEMSISVGPYLRFGDAFYAVMRLNWMGISLGVSYDINISDLSDASNGNGGYEFSLSYIGNFGSNPSRGHSVRFK